MIKLEHTEVVGWEHAIRGMRNPMNSWEKSDSGYCKKHLSFPHRLMCESCDSYNHDEQCCMPVKYIIGPNDHELMMKLRNAGTDHRKFMRMIVVYLDITAPLFLLKELDTYKVGTVSNSCSTMHTLPKKEFTLEDFSWESLSAIDIGGGIGSPYQVFKETVRTLNGLRELYLKTNDKSYWRQMIEILPSSYNQKRTVLLNYEVLANIYRSRKNHKLQEWRDLCKWIEGLPYSEIITGVVAEEAEKDG